VNRIVITLGDPAGIGGEIVFQAASRLTSHTIPVVIGDRRAFETLSSGVFKSPPPPFKRFGEGAAGDIELIDLGPVRSLVFGTVQPAYGEAAYQYILEAIRLLSVGSVAAVVTCPISKKAIHDAGIPFVGHTELFAHYAGVTDYVMMMAAGKLRVSLATIHIPLRDVPVRVTAPNVLSTIAITARSLVDYFGVASPHIKVCGLNPHAGEQGAIGAEDTVVAEAVRLARDTGIVAEGPFPADSLFHAIDADAYVAMYHDQGLIPVKTRDFRRTVNITLGLPFIRTSVDHGTALDLAGTGRAEAGSLLAAIEMALEMVNSER